MCCHTVGIYYHIITLYMVSKYIMYMTVGEYRTQVFVGTHV
jgi:hypothetical protein